MWVSAVVSMLQCMIQSCGDLCALEVRDTILNPEECHWAPQQCLFCGYLHYSQVILDIHLSTLRIPCHVFLPSQIAVLL